MAKQEFVKQEFGSGSNSPGFNPDAGAQNQNLSQGMNNGQGDGSLPMQGGSGNQLRRGVCKFFNSQKGFGFVLDNNPDDLSGQEVFVHFTSIQSKNGFRSLAEGEEVEYEVTTGPKGFQAVNVTGPGGRAVQGDPKARMMPDGRGGKQQFMHFSPIMGNPYGMDPYIQQHPGVMYSGNSPYTSHILYVPQQQGQFGGMMPGQAIPVPVQQAPGQFSPQMTPGAGGYPQQGQQNNRQNNAFPPPPPPQQVFGQPSNVAGGFGPVGGSGGYQQGGQSPFGNGGRGGYAQAAGGGSQSAFGGFGNGLGLGNGSAPGGDEMGAFNAFNGQQQQQQQPQDGQQQSFFGPSNLLYSSN